MFAVYTIDPMDPMDPHYSSLFPHYSSLFPHYYYFSLFLVIHPLFHITLTILGLHGHVCKAAQQLIGICRTVRNLFQTPPTKAANLHI